MRFIVHSERRVVQAIFYSLTFTATSPSTTRQSPLQLYDVPIALGYTFHTVTKCTNAIINIEHLMKEKPIFHDFFAKKNKYCQFDRRTRRPNEHSESRSDRLV